MVKTIKPGVLHKGKILKAGALLSLTEEGEKRLVEEGWAAFVETWPTAGGESETSALGDSPKTDAPEEQEKKPHTRSRGTRKSGTPRRTNEQDF